MNYHTRVWLAVRVALRGKLRTLVFASIIFIPVLIVVVGIVVGTGLTRTRDEIVEASARGDYTSIDLASTSSVEALAYATKALDRVGISWTSTAVRVGPPGVPVEAPAAATATLYSEQDWSLLKADLTYRFIGGGYPYSERQVAISQDLAEELRAEVGDLVDLSFGTEVQVSGVFINRFETNSIELLGGAGTWSRVSAPEIGFIDADLSIVLQSKKASDVEAALSALGDSAMGVTTPPEVDPVPFYFRQPLLVLVPVLLLLVGASVAIAMIRLRRMRSDFLMLSALGASDKDIRNIIVLSNLIVVAPSALLGMIAGATIGIVASDEVAAVAYREVSSKQIPIGQLLLVLLTALVVAAGSAWFISSRIVNDVRVGASGRPFSDNIPVVRLNGRRGQRRAAQLLSILGGVVAFLATSDMLAAILLCGCGASLIAASSPDIFCLTEKLARTISSRNLGFLLAGRDSTRTAAITTVVALAISAPIALLIVGTSETDAVKAAYQSPLPPDQVRIRTLDEVIDPTGLADIASAAQSPIFERSLLVEPSAAGSAPLNWTLAGDGLQSSIEVVVAKSVDEVAGLSGYQPSRHDVNILNAGSILYLDGGASKGANLSLVSPAGTQLPINATPADTTFSGYPGVQAFILKAQLPDAPQFATHVADYRVGGGVNRLPEIIAAGVRHRISPSAFVVEKGPVIPPNVPALVSIGLMSIAAVAVIVSLSVSSAKERRRILTQLWQLGLSPSALSLTSATVGAAPIAVGICAGYLVALLSGSLALSDSPVALSIPWREMVVCGVVVVLVSVAATRLGSGRTTSGSKSS